MFVFETRSGTCVVNATGSEILKPGNYVVGMPQEGKMLFADQKRVTVLHDDGKRYMISRAALLEEPFSIYSSYSEGLAACGAVSERQGYIDSFGHWEIEPKYQEAFSFRMGLAIVEHPTRGVCVINRRGSELAVFNGSKIYEPRGLNRSRDPLAFLAYIKKRSRHRLAMVSGLSKVLEIEKLTKHWGDVRDIADGVFGLEVAEGSWRLFSSAGECVSDETYLYMFESCGGLVVVQSTDRKWGCIDVFGRCVIPCEFDKLGSFRSGFHRARRGSTSFVIARNGAPFLSSDKADFNVFDEGVVCRSEHGILILDWKGNVIWRWPDKLRRRQLGLKVYDA